MSKKYALAGIFAIMALAVFFRLWQIKTIPPGFYPDEAIYANNALETWENKDFKIFYLENNGREGLWINILSPALAVFGNKPWVSRSVAAFFGILTVLGLYFLAKELFKSERIALLASFFMATSFWHINFSRIGFRAILAPFFLVWSFYFLWKAFAKAKFLNSLSLPRQRRGARPHLEFKNLLLSPAFIIALGGILFGLGFHTYIAYRVAPFLLIIPFALMWRTGQKKLIFIFLFFTFIAALPLGIYFLKNPQDFLGRASQVSIFSAASPVKELGINIAKTIGMFFYRGDYNWRHNLAGIPQLWWPVAILFLIGIVHTIKRAAVRIKILGISNLQTNRGSFQFLLVWLVIMLAPTVISSESLPHALRAIVIIPPVIIFSGLGLNWIVEKISDWLKKKISQYPENTRQLNRIRKQFVILLLAFLIAVAGNAFGQYFLRWAPNLNVYYAFSGNYAELGYYLNGLPKNIPKYIIVNADGVDVHGIPMPAQTIMFVTKTYLPEWQNEKNIFYVPMPKLDQFIEKAIKKDHLYIAMLEVDSRLRNKLKEKVNGLKTDSSSGIIILYR